MAALSEFFAGLSLINLVHQVPGAVASGLIWGIMAIGVFLTFRILDIADLTVDGSFATGGAVCVLLITNGVNVWLAMLVAFIAGMLAGFVTGILMTKMGIPAILAGILTQLALYSINLHIMAGSLSESKSQLPVGRGFSDVLVVKARYVQEVFLQNPIVMLLVITVVVIVLLFLFFKTEYGNALRAIGANQNMSRAQGINTERGKVFGLMLSNGLVAFSGALFAQYSGNTNINIGKGAIVTGLAAVIIGEVLISRHFRSVLSKLIAASVGAIIYYLVLQIVLWLGLNTDDLKLMSAAIVAVFLAIPYWKKKAAASKKVAAPVKGGKADA